VEDSNKPATDAKGDFYTTLKEYLERNKDKHENRVFYATDEVSQATYIELFKGQGLEILYMDSFIDTHFIPSLERDYSDVKFSRVDADLDDTLLDKEKESEIVDPSTNKTRDDEMKEMFEKAINKPRVNVKPQALKGENAHPPPWCWCPKMPAVCRKPWP
jgi:molecular chaperone HtpG